MLICSQYYSINIKNYINTSYKFFREAVKCGDVIRLEHLQTKKNLHSHHFSSPISGNQEVSAFGDKGVGDTGDHWSVLCDGKFWERDDLIKLKHVDTDV